MTLAKMQAAPRWCLWNSEQRTRRDGSVASVKVPYYVDGSRRRGDLNADQAQLVTYAEASTARALWGFSGIGFALGDGWQGVDLDHVDARPELAALVADLPGYVERSPSGTGVHAIGYGQPFRALGSNSSGVEAYAESRFFTFTGDALRDGPLADLGPFVSLTLSPMHASAAARAGNRPPRPPATPTGDEVADELADALRYLDADDRETWIAAGQALCSLGDAGYSLWAAWSDTPKFPGGDDLEKWHTFKGDRTGYAAIFARAAAAGWSNPRKRDLSAIAFGAAPVPAALSLVPVPPAPPIPPARYPRTSLADVHTRPEAPQSFVVDKILPAGEVTLLGAHGGAGKSMLSLQAAVCVAAGLPFMGVPVRRGRVLVFSGEDSPKTIRRRLARIFKHYGVDPATAADLVVLDATESPVLFGENGITADLARLRLDVAEIAPSLVIVDNASDAFAGNENDRAQVREFVRILAALVKPIDAAMLLLAHVDKATVKVGGSEGYSGSTAWHNSARSRLFLTVEGTVLTLTHQKSNAGLLAEPLYLMRGADGVLLTGQAPGGSDDRAAVLQLIATHCERGVTISPHPSAKNNAYAVLRNDAAFPASLKKDEFGRVLASLFSSGEIFNQLFSTADRKERMRIAVAGTGVAPSFAPRSPPIPP